jgi:Transposase DDE domain/Insertion element 4 transposase N-terminal
VSESVTSPPGSLRDVVLAGPGAGVDPDGAARAVPLRVVATPAKVRSALAAVGHVDARRGQLTGAVTTVLVLGLCLFLGEGCPTVLARLWPYLSTFNPLLVLVGGPVTAAAVSQARTRLPAGVLRALFEAGAGAAGQLGLDLPGLRVFGLLVTAVDGTVFDLAGTDENAQRFAIPSGGRFPQARLVTLVVCGTRRVLAAVLDSCALSEQALWDRLAGQLTPGTLNLADRNFFSMARWVTAATTGAHLIWRVKNGPRSLPARVIRVLPDGSVLVRLRESDSMLSRRRAHLGDPTAPRLPDTTARLVEFRVTTTDQAGRSTSSRFRVLTTLLDHVTHPANEIATCYARRWQVELTYKTIKSTLRGPGRRLRGESPDLAEQELWGLLAVYNALVDQALAAAADLGIHPDEISFTAVLRATRDHLTRHTPCAACGHQPTPADLTAAIYAGPRNRPGRQRTGPRTAKERKTQHTRNVHYTIEIATPDLPKADIPT